MSSLQALGNACFDLDPDKRPTFKECVEQLSGMLEACVSTASSLEPREQTRPAIESSDVPDVLTCCNQVPIKTEVDLVPLPDGTAVAA